VQPGSDDRAQRRAGERLHRRRLWRNRLIALALAAATLLAITLVSRNPPPPPTVVSAVGSGRGHLAAGSSTALPGNILVADRANNRLIVVSPRGQLAWSMQVYQPTAAFVSPDGASIVVTQRSLFTVLDYDVANGYLAYYYGRAGRPGAADNRLRAPESAQQLRDGRLVVADESNCRVLVLAPPAKRPAEVYGRPGSCSHNPPTTFSDPDSAFAAPGGGLVVTELRPAWIDLLGQAGNLITALRVPGFRAPIDATEFAPGRIVVTNHSAPGAVEALTTAGRVLWRYAPTSGAGELRFPSLAQMLPDGDVLVSDSGDDRIVVIDPQTETIVWQYGHSGRPGRRAGYLYSPDSAVLVRP
jgi:DNA-binding beta-propeller fold protein YncE